VENNIENIFLVIPARNEAGRIEKVIEKSLSIGIENIVVVNDASTDDTASVVSQFKQVILLNHLINLGPGGATQTGIEYALTKDATYIATIDADFQHDPSEIFMMLKKIREEDLDMVIGSRFLKQNNIPFQRIIFNKIGNAITFLLTGKSTSDSQSGFKIIKASLARELKLECNGFEFCIELINTAHRLKAKIEEVPISVIYTKETMKKGQSLSSGFSMIGRLFSPFN